MLAYLTEAEADELEDDMIKLLTRYQDRLDHPERRPADAIPVEVLTFAYPLMNLAGLAAPPETGEDQS
jgi:hypothetical protein